MRGGNAESITSRDNPEHAGTVAFGEADLSSKLVIASDVALAYSAGSASTIDELDIASTRSNDIDSGDVDALASLERDQLSGSSGRDSDRDRGLGEWDNRLSLGRPKTEQQPKRQPKLLHVRLPFFARAGDRPAEPESRFAASSSQPL